MVGTNGQATNINSMAIISDLQQFQTTVFDENLKRCSSRVDGIFN
jgi:hypothetical protein